jgi:hypothetical protein
MDPAVIQLIGTLGGVFIGAAGSWLGFRSQYHLKELELKEQARLRGKELLFQNYQKKVDGLSEELGSLGKGVGSILGFYAGTDEEAREQLDAAFFRIAKESVGVVRERFQELEEARKNAGLEAASPVQMQCVRDFLTVDMDAINTQDEIRHTLVSFIKTTALIPALWQDVLDTRSTAIFGEYVPDSRLLKP